MDNGDGVPCVVDLVAGHGPVVGDLRVVGWYPRDEGSRLLVYWLLASSLRGVRNGGPFLLRLAHPLVKAQPVAGDCSRVGLGVLVPIFREVVTREDLHDAGLVLRLRGVYPRDLGVGVGAPQQGYVQHPRQLDVVSPVGATGHEGRVLLARYAAPDVSFRCFGHSVSSSKKPA